MSARIKINGIYDKRTLNSLDLLNVGDVGFDFRPTSMNFLQQHVALELLKDFQAETRQFTLHYQNEPDFIIQKMVDDIKELEGFSHQHKVSLEFSDIKDHRFYDQFETPFYWHFDYKSSLKDILNSKFIKGIIIPFHILEEAHKTNTLYKLVKNFHSQAFDKINNGNLELGLSLEWDSDIFPSIVEFFDFDLLSLSVNNKVEVCYRNVDLLKIKEGIEYLKTVDL